MDRTEIDARLNALAARVPGLRDEHLDKDDLLAELAGELDVVEDGATNAVDAAYAAKRVDDILAAAGCLVE